MTTPPSDPVLAAFQQKFGERPVGSPFCKAMWDDQLEGFRAAHELFAEKDVFDPAVQLRNIAELCRSVNCVTVLEVVTQVRSLAAELLSARRENAELRGKLREIAPAVREIFWIACVWNDHNFSDRNIREKAKLVADHLGCLGHDGIHGPVERANDWLASIDSAMRDEGEPQ